MVINCTVVG
jgi:hypothetical protein